MCSSKCSKRQLKPGEINCDRSNPPNEVVLEKYYYGLGAKNKLG